MSHQPNCLSFTPDQFSYGFELLRRAPHRHAAHRFPGRGGVLISTNSTHPVWVPVRVSLLTGMNATKAGVLDNVQFLRPDCRQCDIKTWPELLTEAGYSTVAVGRGHSYPCEKRIGCQCRIIATGSGGSCR